MRATLLILVLTACGGAKHPAPAPTHAPTPAPAKPGPDATASAPSSAEVSLKREIAELEQLNAAHLTAIHELETGIQSVDDSEDPAAKRREDLQKLHTQRNELVKTVAATLTRAKAAANTRDVPNALIKNAEEQRERADRSLRDLDDLKAKLGALERSIR